MRSRAFVALPAILLAFFASPARAQQLECREVDVEWREEPVWWCKRDWNPPGSRIPEEQRKTLNAVVLLTVVAPMSRMKR